MLDQTQLHTPQAVKAPPVPHLEVPPNKQNKEYAADLDDNPPLPQPANPNSSVQATPARRRAVRAATSAKPKRRRTRERRQPNFYDKMDWTTQPLDCKAATYPRVIRRLQNDSCTI